MTTRVVLRTMTVTIVALGTAAVVIVVAGALLVAAGARLVVTDSIPRGIYVLADRPIERRVVVGGCMPPSVAREAAGRVIVSGSCPGHLAPFFKLVAAIAGDTVDESPGGVRVDGAVWPWSRPRTRDGHGRALPALRGSYRVPAGDVLLLGLNPTSFDGRYFGPVAIAGLRVYRPLLIERSRYATRLQEVER